ncbi:MAG TPA: NUDIX domain-containing protein [Gammaproteobacteria bacterium]|nr:NUDIX domain-containing protein [Gammaproteobacteria bacterium]
MSPYFRQLRAKIGHDLLLLPAVAAVIRDSDGRLLLQERSAGDGWSLPAGLIEPGESPEQCLRREVLEETGFVVVPTRIIGVFGGEGFRHVYPNGDVVEATVVLYRCVVVGEEPGGPSDPETKSLRWFPRVDMPKLGAAYPLEALFGGA